MTIRLIEITEQDVGFSDHDSEELAKAYAAGFAAGGGNYGAGHCACYFEEELEELKEHHPELADDIDAAWAEDDE